MNNTNEWIPLSTGQYPKEGEIVQVTYLSHYFKKPYCNQFAFFKKGFWYWDGDSDPVRVEITAWKKNSKPYTERIGPITEMSMKLKFDRPIEKEKHYISPGGYAFRSGGKTYRFDFLNYEGNIDQEDPSILYAEVHHLDKNYSDDMSDFNADALEAIEEFFVYTGEYGDPEIHLKSVLSLTVWQGNMETNINQKLLPIEETSTSIEEQMQSEEFTFYTEEEVSNLSLTVWQGNMETNINQKLLPIEETSTSIEEQMQSEEFTFYTEEEVSKLQEYIEDNFTLNGTSRRLVRGILNYVAVQEDDADAILTLLEELLAPIGIERGEIVAACSA